MVSDLAQLRRYHQIFVPDKSGHNLPYRFFNTQRVPFTGAKLFN